MPKPLCQAIDPAIWEFLERAQAGQITHEELAGLFVGHVPAAQAASLEEVLNKLRTKLPTQDALNTWLATHGGRLLMERLLLLAFFNGPRNEPEGKDA